MYSVRPKNDFKTNPCALLRTPKFGSRVKSKRNRRRKSKAKCTEDLFPSSSMTTNEELRERLDAWEPSAVKTEPDVDLPYQSSSMEHDWGTGDVKEGNDPEQSLKDGISFINVLIISIMRRVEAKVSPEMVVCGRTSILGVVKNILKLGNSLGSLHFQVFGLLIKILVSESEEAGSSVDLLRTARARDLLMDVCGRILSERVKLSGCQRDTSRFYSSLCRDILSLLKKIDPKDTRPVLNMNKKGQKSALIIDLIDRTKVSQDLSCFLILNGMGSVSDELLEELVGNFIDLFIFNPKYRLYTLLGLNSDSSGRRNSWYHYSNTRDFEGSLNLMSKAHWILPEVRCDPRRYFKNLPSADDPMKIKLRRALNGVDHIVDSKIESDTVMAIRKAFIQDDFFDMAPLSHKIKLMS